MDADHAPYNPDFVGLAVVNVTHGMVDFPAGFWQYRTSFDEEWMNITVPTQNCIVTIYSTLRSISITSMHNI